MEKPYFWDCESCEEIIQRLKSFTEFSSDSPGMRFSQKNNPEGYAQKVKEFETLLKHKGIPITKMPFQTFTRKYGLRQQMMYLAIVEKWDENRES